MQRKLCFMESVASQLGKKDCFYLPKNMSFNHIFGLCSFAALIISSVFFYNAANRDSLIKSTLVCCHLLAHQLTQQASVSTLHLLFKIDLGIVILTQEQKA